MKNVKRIISIVLALACMLGCLSVTSFAKSTKKAAPISLEVTASKSETGTLGMIKVTVKVTNKSKSDIKNVVVSSAESEGICMYKPFNYNVTVKNPGAADLKKTNAITTVLKAGGTLQYSYFALLGYDYSAKRIPESTRKIMLRQHQMLKTLGFREISITGGSSVDKKGTLTFGDVKTKLHVTAYCNISDAKYESIAAGGTVSETRTTTASSTAKSTNTEKTETTTKTDKKNSVIKSVTDKVTTTTTAAADFPEGKVVCNVDTHIYHTKDCGHLPTKYRQDMTLANAQSHGYTLCSYCKAA